MSLRSNTCSSDKGSGTLSGPVLVRTRRVHHHIVQEFEYNHTHIERKIHH
jgi:hypothetical protein